MQLTLVSHYGPKPAAFEKKIRLLQSMLAEQLGNGFKPYAVEQVHGTIIGLEGARVGTQIRNENFRRLRGTERVIDIRGLLRFLRTWAEPDWNVRLGGFDPTRDHGFISAGQHPFARSFSVRDEIAVAMGWPHCSGVFVPSLDKLRREFQQFGALHKWHQRESDVDNDFFFVLGRLQPDVEPTRRDAAQESLRRHLASAPLLLPMSRHTFCFVAYHDPQLPPATSQVFKLNDERVTGGVLADIYDDCTAGPDGAAI